MALKTYSDKQIITKLRKHLITEMGSFYTMHRPSYQAIIKRRKKDAAFNEMVEDVVNEANHKWHKMGLDALTSDNSDFNTTLFKYYTQNKKPFIDNEAIDLEERITKLEEVSNVK